MERWLIAPAFGLLAGWVTAALLVSIATTLVANWASALTSGAAILSALLVAAVLFAVVRRSGYGAALRARESS